MSYSDQIENSRHPRTSTDNINVGCLSVQMHGGGQADIILFKLSASYPHSTAI